MLKSTIEIHIVNDEFLPRFSFYEVDSTPFSPMSRKEAFCQWISLSGNGLILFPMMLFFCGYNFSDISVKGFGKSRVFSFYSEYENTF